MRRNFQKRATFFDVENQVYLSAVSAWEIAVKNALGKLPLPDTPSVFVQEQRELAIWSIRIQTYV